MNPQELQRFPLLTPTSVYLRYMRQRVLENIQLMSRTAKNGTVDVSVSPEKKAMITDSAKVIAAIEAAMDFAMSKVVESGVDLSGEHFFRELVSGIAVRVQRATLGDDLSEPVLRKHPIPYGRRIPADALEPEWQCFVSRLAHDFSATTDPIGLAAWVEKETDFGIHPFTDGCGRISKLISMSVLVAHHQPAPVLPAREVYYSAMEGRMACPEAGRKSAVLNYLAGIPGQMASRIQQASPDEQFSLCYRHWIDSCQEV